MKNNLKKTTRDFLACAGRGSALLGLPVLGLAVLLAITAQENKSQDYPDPVQLSKSNSSAKVTFTAPKRN